MTHPAWLWPGSVAIILWSSLAAVDGHAHMIPSSADPAARIYVNEKLPAGAGPRDVGKAVLFVHGATYPGLSFDLPVPGYNWMEYVAERGYAAYALDIRGYGRSSRPPELGAAAAANPPVMRADEAIHDILDAVDFIRRRTGLAKVSVIGWSWGTVTGGMFTARYPMMVDKLVLYAPVYARYLPDRLRAFHLADPDDESRFNPAIGAYRTVGAAAIRARWENQIVPEDKSAWRDEVVAATWIDALLASDPDNDRFDPPSLRAPNGVLVDVFEIFSGRPVYDAADITVPTLVVRGADDPTSTDADARGLYDCLGAGAKEYVVIEDGTHFISLERNAQVLMQEVQRFLDAPAG